jgi:hypothetical protein
MVVGDELQRVGDALHQVLAPDQAHDGTPRGFRGLIDREVTFIGNGPEEKGCAKCSMALAAVFTVPSFDDSISGRAQSCV